MNDQTNFMDAGSGLLPVDGLGAVILCGGHSSRMGFPKHELWFEGKTFLQSVADSVIPVADRVVAVVGHGESSPESMPKNVQMLRDEQPDLGPLEGIRTALIMLEPHVSHAFVTSCDVPNLRPQLIRKLVDMLGEHDAVVPMDGTRVYGMTAVYRTALHSKIDEIYVSGVSRRVSALQAMVNTCVVPLDELKDVDPDLDSFTNVNTADEYFELLRRCGMTCPAELAARLATR